MGDVRARLVDALQRHKDVDRYSHRCCSCGWDAACDPDADKRWAEHFIDVVEAQ